MAVSIAVYFAAVLIFPLDWAILAIAASSAAAQLLATRPPWFKLVFNVGQATLSTALAGLVWRAAGPERSLLTPEAIPWGLLALFAYFATNTVLVSAIVALASGVPFRLTWWRANRHNLPAMLGMLFVGALIAVLWSISAWTVALATVPLAALYYSLRNTTRLETQTIDALFHLADILDARDPYTHGHSLRVGEYAEKLALALGVSGDRAYLVHLAGRLHDIGKCAIRNEVLMKPGPLTDDERTHMCQHAEVGGSMLASFELFKECARFVRGHHERWDGAGYPDRLTGADIPLGARVIAVADAYDAMTTTRPYRSALSVEEAVRRLREGAGSQWDPQAVAAFVRLVEAGHLAASTIAPVPILHVPAVSAA